METNLGFHCHRLSHVEERILANGLSRGEFYHIPPSELRPIREMLSRHGLAASIHCPLVKPPWYPEPPTWAFLCDRDPEKRELNFRMVEQTVEMAGDFGAQYVVVHFPSPPSTGAADMSHDEMRRIAWASGERLADLSQRYGMPLHVEGFGPSPLLGADFIVALLNAFPPLRYCYDTGHMNIAAERDGLDVYDFLERVAPHVGSIHLWNTRGIDDYMHFHHIPVHPSQHPDDGWADIARILRQVVTERHSLPLVFESQTAYPRALGARDYRDGVRWIRELLTTSS